MIEAGAPCTSEFQECYPKSCARPTGGSHARTTRGPAQRFSRAKSEGRARCDGKRGAASSEEGGRGLKGERNPPDLGCHCT